jgi:hypothetical protein
VPTTGPNLKSWKLQFSNHTCHPSPQQISWIIITFFIIHLMVDILKIHKDFSIYIYIYVRVEVKQIVW